METNANLRRWVGRAIGAIVVIAAAAALLMAVEETDRHPRTDDANVRANFIEIAPEVSGRLINLPVKDNAYVKKGGVLFEIDPRPYQYALKQALSDQEALEQQIVDTRRRIAAETSAVEAARAGVINTKTGIRTAATTVDAAKAAVSRAEAAVAAAEAQLKLATNNLNRIQPLLQKQYVTVEQVDHVSTQVRVAQGQYDEAQAALNQAKATEGETISRQEEATARASESEARLGQAVHTVDTVDTLVSQRPSRSARVLSAQLDLERCKVVAPFDAYVTNMNISEGAYARPGVAIFTLIDSRTWYVIANYRESKIKNIKLGEHVDVYLLGHPDRKFNGVVESIGFGVFPEDGRVSGGLPDIQRTLNWVHLSTRFPVRVRVQDSDPALFRMGATAVTIVR
jgi:multidrug efflux system membrane fusion protein